MNRTTSRLLLLLLAATLAAVSPASRGRAAGEEPSRPSAAVERSVPPAMDAEDPAGGGVLGAAGSLPPARLRLEVEMGRRFLRQGLHDRAEASFRRVTASAPGHPGGWDLLSRALLAGGRAAEARDAAQRALAALHALPPTRRAGFDAAAFHRDLARAQAATVQLEEAVASFERAAWLDPDDAETWYQLGTLRARLGRDEQALEAYRRHVQLDPRRARGYLGLGQSLLRTGDVPGAREALSQALERAPEDADVHYALASLHRLAGEVELQEAALARYEELSARVEEARQRRQAVDALLREATVALADDDCGTAAPVLERLLEDPVVAGEGFRRPRILAELARCRERDGDVGGALSLYRTALRDQPGSFTVSFELGALLARTGRVEEAMPYLLAATVADPFSVPAHLNLARAHGLLGRLNDALGELRKAATLQPDDVEVRQELADLEWAVGHRAQARALAEALGGVVLQDADGGAPDDEESP